MSESSAVGLSARGGLLASYLKAGFAGACPPGWRCLAEQPLLAPADRALLGYDPRADVVLERQDGARRLWIEFEISRADPAANHAKFATAHALRPWSHADAFVSMISAHVVRGRRNLGAGMIQVMRQVGIDAFQTVLLPDLDRDGVKRLNHDAHALQAASPSIQPEIERALTVAEPLSRTENGRLHFAADVFDVLLNLRAWNDDAAQAAEAARWRRRAVRYLVLDPKTGWCAPAKFAAYILLPSDHATAAHSVATRAAPAAGTVGSPLTFARYSQLDQHEPLFDGHRAWTHLVERLRFSRQAYGESATISALVDAWHARHQHLVQLDRERLTILIPPPAFR